MSIKLMSQIWETSPYSHTMLLLHVAMADAANDEGEFWYKQKTLAAKARVSERYLRDVIQRMIEDGFLTTYKRGRRLAYRLLTPELSSGMKPEPSSGQKGNSVPVLYEPSVEPSVSEPSPTSSAPSGDAKGATVKPVGLDDQEMPEEGRVQRPEKKFDSAPKKGTHGWVVYEWERGISRNNLRPRYNKGHLHRLLKNLRDEGMSNEEIVVLIEYFFARNEGFIRTKRSQIDLTKMFEHMVPQLQTQAQGKISGLKRGWDYDEKNREQAAELRRKMSGA